MRSRNLRWMMLMAFALTAAVMVNGYSAANTAEEEEGSEGDGVEAAPVLTPEEQAAADKAAAEKAAREQAAFAPVILEEIIPAFVSKEAKALAAVENGEKPKRLSPFLRDIVYTLTTYYRQAGIHDYDWHDFGPDMKNATWDCFSFDPPEKKDRSKGSSYRKVTCPQGMENWFAGDFDASKAGWKTGQAPFGQRGGEMVALGQCDTDSECRCGVPPKTLWDKEVLLLRQTFDVPAVKPGHRYRIVVGGSNHVNGGDGFDLYLDGKLIGHSDSGVGKRQGGQPRGGLIYAECLPELADGKITVAFQGFLRYNHPRIPENYPPSGHVSIWLEEQKLPPLGM